MTTDPPFKRHRTHAAGWSVSQIRRAGILQPNVVYDVLQSSAFPAEVVKAIALRGRVMLDLATGTPDDLPRALRAMARLEITKEVLYTSGIGHVLQDATIWSRGANPQKNRLFAAALRQKWQTSVKCAPLIPSVSMKRMPSMRGFQADVFCSDVVEMKSCVVVGYAAYPSSCRREDCSGPRAAWLQTPLSSCGPTAS